MESAITELLLVSAASLGAGIGAFWRSHRNAKAIEQVKSEVVPNGNAASLRALAEQHQADLSQIRERLNTMDSRLARAEGQIAATAREQGVVIGKLHEVNEMLSIFVGKGGQ